MFFNAQQLKKLPHSDLFYRKPASQFIYISYRASIPLVIYGRCKIDLECAYIGGADHPSLHVSCGLRPPAWGTFMQLANVHYDTICRPVGPVDPDTPDGFIRQGRTQNRTNLFQLLVHNWKLCMYTISK